MPHHHTLPTPHTTIYHHTHTHHTPLPSPLPSHQHHHQAGEICCPPKQQLFYLSQRPYLVTGTLRDQLLYPVPPARVWASSNAADQQHYTAVAGEVPQYRGLDEGG